MKSILLFVLSLTFSSCTSPGVGTGGFGDFEGVVVKRAAYDFKCSESSIKTTQMGMMKYGAMGCGKKAEYKVKCTPLCIAEQMQP